MRPAEGVAEGAQRGGTPQGSHRARGMAESGVDAERYHRARPLDAAGGAFVVRCTTVAVAATRTPA